MGIKKKKHENGTDYSFFKGKKLIRNVEIPNLVAREYHRCKKIVLKIPSFFKWYTSWLKGENSSTGFAPPR